MKNINNIILFANKFFNLAKTAGILKYNQELYNDVFELIKFCLATAVLERQNLIDKLFQNTSDIEDSDLGIVQKLLLSTENLPENFIEIMSEKILDLQSFLENNSITIEDSKIYRYFEASLQNGNLQYANNKKLSENSSNLVFSIECSMIPSYYKDEESNKINYYKSTYNIKYIYPNLAGEYQVFSQENLSGRDAVRFFYSNNKNIENFCNGINFIKKTMPKIVGQIFNPTRIEKEFGSKFYSDMAADRQKLKDHCIDIINNSNIKISNYKFDINGFYLNKKIKLKKYFPESKIEDKTLDIKIHSDLVNYLGSMGIIFPKEIKEKDDPESMKLKFEAIKTFPFNIALHDFNVRFIKEFNSRLDYISDIIQHELQHLTQLYFKFENLESFISKDMEPMGVVSRKIRIDPNVSRKFFAGSGFGAHPIAELDEEFYTYLQGEINNFNRKFKDVPAEKRLSLAKQYVGLEPAVEIEPSSIFEALKYTKVRPRTISSGTGFFLESEVNYNDIKTTFQANNIKDNFIGKQFLVYKSTDMSDRLGKFTVNYVSGNILHLKGGDDVSVRLTTELKNLEDEDGTVGPYYYQIIDPQTGALYGKAVKEFLKAVDAVQ